MPKALEGETSEKIVARMTQVVNQLKEYPESMTDRDRYAMAIWAMENQSLGFVSMKITDRFIELVCPDYWECFLAGVRGER